MVMLQKVIQNTIMGLVLAELVTPQVLLALHHFQVFSDQVSNTYS